MITETETRRKMESLLEDEEFREHYYRTTRRKYTRRETGRRVNDSPYILTGKEYTAFWGDINLLDIEIEEIRRDIGACYKKRFTDPAQLRGFLSNIRPMVRCDGVEYGWTADEYLKSLVQGYHLPRKVLRLLARMEYLITLMRTQLCHVALDVGKAQVIKEKEEKGIKRGFVPLPQSPVPNGVAPVSSAPDTRSACLKTLSSIYNSYIDSFVFDKGKVLSRKRRAKLGKFLPGRRAQWRETTDGYIRLTKKHVIRLLLAYGHSRPEIDAFLQKECKSKGNMVYFQV